VDRLGANPVALQIPVGVESDFTGVIDLIEMCYWYFGGEKGEKPERREIPGDYIEAAREAREKLIEAIASVDDQVMISYVEGHPINEHELKTAIRRACIAGTATPVLCGAALRNRGIQPLLDAIVDYLPSPVDIPAVKGIDPRTGEEITREASDDAPLAALAFKIVADPYVGRLAYIRVYSGVLRNGDTVYNATKGEKERIGRLLRMHANERHEIDAIYAGGIAAAVGLKRTFTGDTLCAPDAPILLESISFPEPVISVAIEPKTKDDADKLADVLQKMSEEDPTFRWKFDEETGQTIISGMGELHLEVIVDRMFREYKVATTMGRPQVSYREAIVGTAQAEGRFIRQTGGRGQ
ncbi:MAG: EF-Tu/IF-2/RF-3 family GTPase, partial [Dehalococcoidia bacterium]|nr:EF-Tu/IF-2/RF-3 family GTPase [Dehalococcoidia bacterium]